MSQNQHEKKPHDEPQGKDEITIHIGKTMYKVSLPVKGATLYQLGGVDKDQYDLWLEIHGQGDDIMIYNNDDVVDIKNGTHFYTAQKNLNPGACHV